MRFLLDTPSKKDFFGTHKKLAEAIASTIATNPDVRSIGLLGKWGSGKSTVIEQLPDAVAKYRRLIGVRIFTYDAWEHQGEPTRRSFLESLFKYLTKKPGMIDQAIWQKEIDKLAGRRNETETINTAGPSEPARELLLSGTLVPFGFALFGLDSLHEGLGATSTFIGKSVLLASIFLLIAPVIFLVKYVFSPRPVNEHGVKEDPFSIIIDKKPTNEAKTTITSTDPTAIEFSVVCAKLLNELNRDKKKLIIVVDNLDRLPAEEAIKMWSTLRSIFTNSTKNLDEGASPIVIVPMDSTALDALFGKQSPAKAVADDRGAEEDASRSNSFIQKTFDLTFYVPPPVRSDWKDFLRTQMRTIFGAKAIDDRVMYLVERIFDKRYKSIGQFPTPRNINRFVNSTAALKLSRKGEKFAIPVLALYASHAKEIDDNLMDFLEDPKNDILRTDFPKWQEQVAALHFGVSKAKSIQVLLQAPMQSSIQDENMSEFRRLIGYPGALKIFEDYQRSSTADMGLPDGKAQVFRLAEAVTYLPPDAEVTKRSWAYLYRRISLPSVQMTLFDFSRLYLFEKHLPDASLEGLSKLQQGWLSAIALTISKEEDRKQFSEIVQHCRSISNTKFGLTLSGENVSVATALYWIDGMMPLEQNLAVQNKFSELAPTLIEWLEGGSQARMAADVLSLRSRIPEAFPKEPLNSLSAIAVAAANRLREGLGTHPSATARALGLTARMDGQAAEKLKALVSEGVLEQRLRDSIDDELVDNLPMFWALKLLYDETQSVDFSQLSPDDLPELYASTITALDVLSNRSMNAIWAAFSNDASSKWLEGLVRNYVTSGNVSEQDLDVIAANPDYYLSTIPSDVRKNLIRKLGGRIDLLDRVAEKSSPNIFSDIFSSLLGLKVGAASSHVRSKLEGLTTEDWTEFLSENTPWIRDLIKRPPDGYQFTASSPAIAAIIEKIQNSEGRLAGPERNRAQRIVELSNRYALVRLGKSILGLIDEIANGMISSLPIFSDAIERGLKERTEISDITRLLFGLSRTARGQRWLEDRKDFLRALTETLSKSDRARLQAWFDDVGQLRPKERRNWLRWFKTELSLDM